MSVNDFTLTQEYLHEIFEYKDGELFWKKQVGKRAKIHNKVGSLTKRGYTQTQIKRKTYLLHRIIFFMFHGYMPKYLDHINGVIKDNRIENLRDVTLYQNSQNQKIHKNNSSGVKNVYWHKATKKWRIQLRINGTKKSFGSYDDLELAEFVAIEARNKYHGKFARHN
jgi:hypothetical protein